MVDISSNTQDQRAKALAEYGIMDTPREARFDSITRTLADTTKSPIAYVAFLEPHRLWFKSSVGIPFPEIPAANSMTAKFLNDGISDIDVADIESLPFFKPGAYATDQLGTRALLGKTIVTPEGLPIGAVCVMDVHTRTFSDTDKFAVIQAANAISELLAVRRVAQTVVTESVDGPITGPIEKIGIEENLSEVVDDYMRETLENFDWWAAQAWWYGDNGLTPSNWTTAAHTPKSLRVISDSIFEAEPVVKISKAYLEPTLVALDELDWMQNQKKLMNLGARHAVVMDIFGAAAPTLRLVFIIPSARFFDENTKRFFAVTTSLLPKVITRERVRTELQYRSLHDQLTGLLNRRGLMQWIEESKFERTSNRAVMFLDLDNFKAINDKYGHAIGDELLIHVATELSINTRPTDTIARIGGDEFVIATAETDLDVADQVMAKRVYEALAKSFTLSNGVAWTSAASIGVSAWPAGSNFERALEVADGMMYNAKKAGGGIVFEPKDSTETSRNVLDDKLKSLVEVSKISESATDTPWAYLVAVETKLKSPDLDKLAIDIVHAVNHAKIDPKHLVFQLPKSLWFEEDGISRLLEKLSYSLADSEFSVILNGNGVSTDAKNQARSLRLKGQARTVLSGFGSGNKEFELLQSIQPVGLILDTDLANSVLPNPENEISIKAAAAISQALDLRLIAPRNVTDDSFEIIKELGCRKKIFSLK